MTAAEVLRAARLKQGLSQKQVATKLGVDRSAVSQWELGHNLPSLTTASRLFEVLGMDDVEISALHTAVRAAADADEAA